MSCRGFTQWTEALLCFERGLWRAYWGPARIDATTLASTPKLGSRGALWIQDTCAGYRRLGTCHGVVRFGLVSLLCGYLIELSLASAPWGNQGFTLE